MEGKHFSISIRLLATCLISIGSIKPNNNNNPKACHQHKFACPADSSFNYNLPSMNQPEFPVSVCLINVPRNDLATGLPTFDMDLY